MKITNKGITNILTNKNMVICVSPHKYLLTNNNICIYKIWILKIEVYDVFC